MAGTTILDRISERLSVYTISTLPAGQWSDVLNVEGARRIHVTSNGVDVDMYLPQWDTGTDSWTTDGTNARELEYQVVSGQAGDIRNADNAVQVGCIPDGLVPPRLQFKNDSAGDRNFVVYVTWL